MWSNNHRSSSSSLALWIGMGGVLIGVVAGLLVGMTPLLLALALVAIAIVIYFLACFEQAVMGLLILRSALDLFSSLQLPAVFAIGLIGLTLLYITVKLLTGQTVQTDKFWWLLAGWVVLQGLWVILMPLGGLGLDGSYLSSAIREWIRIFSWLIVYLLLMQLKDKISPHKVISLLFLGLVIPLTIASIQVVLPPSLLPSILVYQTTVIEAGSRINGTFGHPNTFATFLFLFLALTYWKQSHCQKRAPWLILLGVIAFFLVSTKALFGLVMLATFLVCLLTPRLNLLNLIGAIVLFAFIIGLFASTEFGQERLGSIAETPLLNPDIDIWRAILLSKTDGNSFNWRLAQWHYLLGQWQQFPFLGYGLGTSKYISTNGLEPHNDYIRALLEGGIIGLITFLAFIGAQMVRLVQLFRAAPRGGAQRDLCLTLLAVLIGLSVGMITDNIWAHTTLFFYWWTLLAVAGWDWKQLPPSETSVSSEFINKNYEN